MPSPVRLGLIGYGGIAQGYHRPGILANADVVKVTAAADVVPDNLEAAHAHYGVPRDQLYSDYRDMLAKAEIDAVDIATPHFLHAEQSIEAANAGKAVVCEKPMAVSSEQGDAIVEAVKRNGVPYSMGQMFLFCPAVVRGAELMRAEGMGTTFIGRTQTIGRGIEVGPNKEMPPAHVPDWYRTVAGGGGRLNTTTNHELYVLEHLMGSPIRYVEARVGTLHEGVEVDDTAIMLSEHHNGATSITLSSGRFMGDPPLLKRPTTGRFAEAQAPGGGVRAHFSLSPGASARAQAGGHAVAPGGAGPERGSHGTHAVHRRDLRRAGARRAYAAYGGAGPAQHGAAGSRSRGDGHPAGGGSAVGAARPNPAG